MSKTTRMYLWPASLVMSLALVGIVAAFVAMGMAGSQPVQAHGPCDFGTMTGADFAECVATGGDDPHDHMEPTPPPPSTPTNVNEGSATKPSAPVMMSISRATDNQARPVLPGDGKLMIKWAHPDDGDTPITGYDVRYTMTPADDDSWNSINDLPAGKTSYVITGLANEETYYVQVRAENRLGNSPWSARRSGDPVAVPSAPMSISVAGSESRIVVSWDAPASGGDHPIDQYNWDVDDMASNGRDSSGTFGSRAYRMMDSQMFFPESGGAITTSVASDGEGCLTVTVSASNATDDDPDGSTRSLPGDEAMVTCAGAPMLTKQMVDNVAILRWNEPSLGGGTEVTEYVVRRSGYERINPTDTEKLGNLLGPESREWRLGGSERSMWDTGLSHQTGYIYTIYAITDRYDLGYEPDRYKVSDRVTAFTSTDGGLILAPPSPPTAPRSLEAMDQCADRITLSWMAPSNFGGGVDADRNREWGHGKIVVSEAATIEKYDVQYRERGRGSWMSLSATGTGATVTSGLEYDKTYDFRVRAKNDIGLYGPWATASKTLDEPDQPLRPGSPVAKHETNESGEAIITLNWDAPDDSQTELWRSVSDIGTDNMSKSLSYHIQRKIGDGQWETLPSPGARQPHQYIPGETPQQAILHFHKQKLIDNNAAAVRAAAAGQSVKYRVSALVDTCNQSEWISVDEVSGSPDLTLGNASSLSATSTAAGTVQLAWTAGANANVHWVAGIGVNADGSYDHSRTVWTRASSGSSHTVTSLAAGQYLFAVISGNSINGPWSNWTMSNRVTVN